VENARTISELSDRLNDLPKEHRKYFWHRKVSLYEDLAKAIGIMAVSAGSDKEFDRGFVVYTDVSDGPFQLVCDRGTAETMADFATKLAHFNHRLRLNVDPNVS
jgi:hypothetical protein